jgi:hypothetical protein
VPRIITAKPETSWGQAICSTTQPLALVLTIILHDKSGHETFLFAACSQPRSEVRFPGLFGGGSELDEGSR